MSVTQLSDGYPSQDSSRHPFSASPSISSIGVEYRQLNPHRHHHNPIRHPSVGQEDTKDKRTHGILNVLAMLKLRLTLLVLTLPPAYTMRVISDIHQVGALTERGCMGPQGRAGPGDSSRGNAVFHPGRHAPNAPRGSWPRVTDNQLWKDTQLHRRF